MELDGPTEVTYIDNPADSRSTRPTRWPAFNADPVAVEDNTDAVNWYDVDLHASTFTLGQEGPNTVPVAVRGHRGAQRRPTRRVRRSRLGVDFLRGGPGNEDDDGCQRGLLSARRRNGEAFYDFVGGSQGTATCQRGPLRRQRRRIGTVGPDTVLFGRR